MPGIVGLITKRPREWAERQLARMVETLLHEPFYVTGTWIDESLGVYVGWVARANSFADRMPIRNERGDIVLIFSGENYPEPGTARRLKERGHGCEETGPSYLVHLYEDDPNFFKNLNGRFQGLLADRSRGAVTLFNDRFGLQRVYIHEAADSFYFSAEAKAILAVRNELRSVDPRALGEFIACGCVLENRTLFRDIYAQPPGSAWSFRGGALEKKTTYFEPREWEEQEPLDAESYYDHLQDALTNSLPNYFNGQERVGVSLTGGLDTRIIMAWRKAPAGSLPCYTFGSMYRENQDVRLARRVAEICGQPYQVITTGKEFLSQFSHYAERSIYLTDACVDVSRSPDLYVNEKAREIAPVRMVGTYGSEMLLHAVMFKPVEPAAGLFRPELLPQIHAARETYDASRRTHPVSFVAFRQTPWHHYGVLMLEQTQVAVRSPYLDNDLVKTIYRAPGSVAANEDARMRLIRDGNPLLAMLRTDRGIGGTSKLGAAISRAYLEFTFKAEYAYDYGMPQWVAQADHLLAPFHLERLWMGRHKIFHFRLWYKTVLAKYVKEILLDPRTLARPYLERSGVEAVVRGHLKGNRNFTTEIHRLLSLELLHRLFLDAR